MTNSERIRGISDKELAEMLIQYNDDWGRYYCSDGTYYDGYGDYESDPGYVDAVQHEVEWLKQESE